MLKIVNLKVNLDNSFQLKIDYFEVLSGEYVVLVGPSGAGKSLLCNCIAGIFTRYTGQIYIHGKNVNKLPPYKREVGLVYSDYCLFPHLNVYENIAFGLRVRKRWHDENQIHDKNQIIDEAVREIAAFLNIKHLLFRTIKDLSMGERQRVSLARTLILKPKVLLLDEPLNALDAYLHEQTLHLLRQLWQTYNMTVLHVTHNLNEAKMIAQRIAVLVKGKLAAVYQTNNFSEEDILPLFRV